MVVEWLSRTLDCLIDQIDTETVRRGGNARYQGVRPESSILSQKSDPNLEGCNKKDVQNERRNHVDANGILRFTQGGP